MYCVVTHKKELAMKKYFYVVYSIKCLETGNGGSGATTIISTTYDEKEEPQFLIKNAASEIKKLLPESYNIFILSWTEITKLQFDEFTELAESSSQSQDQEVL